MPASPDENQTRRRRGWLVPIGGAEEKSESPVILERICQLCGGADGRILVIPTASKMAHTGPRYVELFESMGARARAIPVNEREDCLDEEILRVLGRSTGVFITGGNQLRLSTILGGTPVARLIRRLSADGVTVAGTSAGAAILAEHMIAGGGSGPTPRERGVTMAPGLGLTNKMIIDQHFRQRDRIGRLLTALSYNPFASGIGIDENTAAFVGPDGVLEVVGSGAITVVDPAGLRHSSMHHARKRGPITLIGMTLHVLAAGARYDTHTREAFADHAD